MGIEDLSLNTVDEENPEVQAIVFPNPEDESMKKYIADETKATEHYIAARWLKRRMGDNSSLIVGQFLKAIRQAELNDDYEELNSLIETIKGDDDE